MKGRLETIEMFLQKDAEMDKDDEHSATYKEERRLKKFNTHKIY